MNFEWDQIISWIFAAVIVVVGLMCKEIIQKAASDLYDWVKREKSVAGGTESTPPPPDSSQTQHHSGTGAQNQARAETGSQVIQVGEIHVHSPPATATKKEEGTPFNIPHASIGDGFVGREGDLKKIEDDLNAGGALAVSASGIGGAGKTRFAAEYAHKNRDKYPGGCFWVPAETKEGGAGAVESSIALLSVPLGLDLPPDTPKEKLIEIILDALSREERTALIIFDNADDWSAIHGQLNRLAHHHILITTRNPNLSNELQTLDLDVLEEAPALVLLLSCCGGERPRPKEGSEDHEAAARIASRLGRLPLALEIAAAYLKDWPDISFDGYDKRLVEEGLADTIDDTPKEFETNTRHEVSVRATFLSSWDALEKSPDAQKLLACAAYFAPESIRADLLAGAAELPTEPESRGRPSPYDAALRAAAGASLLETKGRVSCHRVVSDFVRGKLSEEQRVEAAKSVAASFRSLVNRPKNKLVMALGEVAVEKPHLDTILGWLDRMGEEVAWADLAQDVARYLELRAEYAEAEPLFKRSLEIGEKTLGPDHPDVGARLNNLAGLYESQGRYAEAEPLYKRALEIGEKTLGPDHLNVGATLNNLAALYEALGRYTEAEPLYKRALKIRETALGPDHLDVGTTLNNLAELYRSQGRYAEAEPLYKRALEIRETALGPNHPDVGQTLNNLAALYDSQGRYAEAELLYKRDLEIGEKSLGPDHLSVGTTLNNLGVLYAH